MAKPASHRYDRLPLLPSRPGGVQRELVVPASRCKGRKYFFPGKGSCYKLNKNKNAPNVK